MKRLLIFSYYFPPTGGAGVQRAVNFVKNLPDLGFDCYVLAGTDKNFCFNLNKDNSLDCISNEKVFRITLNKFENLQSKIFPGFIKRYLPSIALRH